MSSNLRFRNIRHVFHTGCLVAASAASYSGPRGRIPTQHGAIQSPPNLTRRELWGSRGHLTSWWNCERLPDYL